jgi:2-aminoethylphosphonate-pyruvate transaminase
MEEKGGKWRFTSPTHVVRAFATAMDELAAEGGVEARHARYRTNQRMLVEGMRALGFSTLLPDGLQSPIITSFLSPGEPGYSFRSFYEALKARGFVVYPGKVTDRDTFRIGNIGEVYPQDIARLLTAVEESMFWRD